MAWLLRRLDPGRAASPAATRCTTAGHVLRLALASVLFLSGLKLLNVAAGELGARRRADRRHDRLRYLGADAAAVEVGRTRSRFRPSCRTSLRLVNRALDVALSAAGLAVAAPVLGAAAAAIKLEDGGPGALPADARRQGRRRLRAAEAADDGRRRREARRRLRRQRGRRAHHARRPRAAAAVARRAAAALERAPRRDEPDRPAADAPLPGRAVHGAPAPAPRREARASPAGRRSTAARRCRGRSGSSSTSGTSSTARRGST